MEFRWSFLASVIGQRLKRQGHFLIGSGARVYPIRYISYGRLATLCSSRPEGPTLFLCKNADIHDIARISVLRPSSEDDIYSIQMHWDGI